MAVVPANNLKRWLSNPAEGFRNRAAGAKPTTGRRVYGAGQITSHRRRVKATVLTTNLALSNDRALRLLFALAASGLPLKTSEGVSDVPADTAPPERLDVGRP